MSDVLRFVILFACDVGQLLDSSWNVIAHGDAQEGKWRGNWRMDWVASTLHTTSEHGVSSITTADAHTSAASSRLNWRPPADLNGLVRFAERRNLVSAACAITFQLTSTTGAALCPSLYRRLNILFNSRIAVFVRPSCCLSVYRSVVALVFAYHVNRVCSQGAEALCVLAFFRRVILLSKDKVFWNYSNVKVQCRHLSCICNSIIRWYSVATYVAFVSIIMWCSVATYVSFVTIIMWCSVATYVSFVTIIMWCSVATYVSFVTIIMLCSVATSLSFVTVLLGGTVSPLTTHL